MHLKMLSAKWQPFCLGFYVVISLIYGLIFLHTLGDISLTIFPSLFIFDGNFIFLSAKFKWKYCSKILHMTHHHTELSWHVQKFGAICLFTMELKKKNLKQNLNLDWKIFHEMGPCPGARFTNDFLPAIQIRWKFCLAVIPLLAIRSQQIFAHVTTAQLSCHVQKVVATTVLESRWDSNEISIEFELRWKKR